MTIDPGGVPRFARGFVLSEQRVEPPEADWLATNVAGLHLAHAPEVQVASAWSGEQFVVVIGHFVDTESWLEPGEAIRSAAEALALSEEAFLDRTDAWSGRYLVVFGTRSSRRVMTDATGMRAAFYSLDGPFVLASHPRLVAIATGAPASPVWAEYQGMVTTLNSRFVTSAPGRLTPWSGVVFLPANQALSIDEGGLHRIFPRGPIPELSTSEAAERLGPLLEGQVSALVATQRPVVLSLTGGLDSRLSLAAGKAVRDDITFFTYRRPGKSGTDEDVAAASGMASALGLRHRTLEVSTTIERGALQAALREACVLSHGRPVVAEYRRSFSPDTMHIRSNVGGVARCFYRSTQAGATAPERVEDISAALLAGVWAHGDTPASIVGAFEDWIDATGFRAVQWLDPLVAFYWEHRLTTWHSNICLESDFAFDTHVLFNARSILGLMLSVPPNDRCGGAIFPATMSVLWPELLRWPFGTKPRISRRKALRQRLPF